jgi:hypothetical protein
MSAAVTIAAILLVAGPVIGAIPIAHPSLMTVWSAPRERYLATIGANRRAWGLLNGGFVLMAASTAAGLLVLALGSDPTSSSGAWLVAVAVADALCAVPWIVVLAIRAARDPLLASMVAAGAPTEPAEALLGSATEGLFVCYVVGTTLAIIALGIVVGAGGIVAWPVAAIASLAGALLLAIQLRTRDTIPVLLYLPTLFIGTALLLGWT